VTETKNPSKLYILTPNYLSTRGAFWSSKEESKMVYFELFHLNPVKANISFVGIAGLEEK
jgi:hypothetical protein